MKDLVAELAAFLATENSMILGTNVFYNEMPDAGTTCVCVYERKTSIGVYPQIDAQVHAISVGVRASSNTAAYNLAFDCYTEMLGTDETPGFITLSSGLAYVWLHGPPVWDKADTQNRKYYTFDATITSKRR